MDIRKEFLEFFKSKGHNIVDTMSLVPNDSTLMFVNAGMVQFKDIFTGIIPAPSNKRATSCQLCLRAGGKHNDLENVGYTARHHTLFEMLGNFSFGDYFKKDAINYAWEFLTINLKLPIDKLWVTVHTSDDEAYEIWANIVSKDRILRFGDKDNFWSMGETGACGPCSEIFYDQGAKHFNGSEDKMGGDGDRFLEIWNLVFMQYDRLQDGTLKPLPKPSIDTGMGLERIIAIKEGVLNNFDSSVFTPLIQKIQSLTSVKQNEKNISSFRVIADHVRAVSFMLCYGILFDKEGRGYVLRRILRRAVRHGYLLGLKKPFMGQVVDTLVENLGEHYGFLKEKQSYIKEQIGMEEERFFNTIVRGMVLFNEELKETKDMFDGEIAFKLYDTFGFPLDLTADMLRQQNKQIDIDKFNFCMEKQKTKAKASWSGSGDDIKDGDFKAILQTVGKNKFIGYEKTSNSCKVLALLDENFKQTNELKSQSIGWVLLDFTPFYATSGGQIGDSGFLLNNNNKIKVLQTEKFYGLNLSQIKLNDMGLKTDDKIEANVVNQDEIAKHHSATHLLQTALRDILGDNVSQAGSLNDANRLRFDFTYSKSLTQKQIDKVESLVNEMIANSLKTNIQELNIDEAKQKGAIANFSEKYGDIVRVVEFGDRSCELCGGIHIKNTSQIGSFYITGEKGVSSGVRRIEAVCGLSAIKYAKKYIQEIKTLEYELKNNNPTQGVAKLKEQIKKLKQELNNANKTATQQLQGKMINDTKIIVDIVKNGDLKQIVDDEKNKNNKLAILLLQIKNGKVLLVSGVKNISNLKAGDWIKTIAPIVGGGGGGRADFAQAGGKDISKIDEAKIKALKFAEDKIKNI